MCSLGMCSLINRRTGACVLLSFSYKNMLTYMSVNLRTAHGSTGVEAWSFNAAQEITSSPVVQDVSIRYASVSRSLVLLNRSLLTRVDQVCQCQ
jgi:hypothetical protein